MLYGHGFLCDVCLHSIYITLEVFARRLCIIKIEERWNKLDSGRAYKCQCIKKWKTIVCTLGIGLSFFPTRTEIHRLLVIIIYHRVLCWTVTVCESSNLPNTHQLSQLWRLASTMLHYFDNNPRCLFYMTDYKFKDNNLRRHNITDFVKTIYILFLFNRLNRFRTWRTDVFYRSIQFVKYPPT